MRALILLLLAALPARAQGGTIEGRVTDSATGRPVAKAEITLRGLVPSGNPPEPDIYLAESDAAGHFLVRGVAPGSYEAAAERPGYLAPRSAERVRLSVEDARHSQAELKLAPAGTISGRVIDTAGDPVSGALLELLQQTPRGLQARARLPSDDRGEYRFFGLAPGRYTLRVAQNLGLQQAPFQPAVQTFRQTAYPAPLDVTPGAELRNVEIRLRLELPHAIRGIVPGPHTGDFTVTLQRRGEPPDPSLSLASGLNDHTFFFDGVLPGTYIVATTIHDPSHPEQALYGSAQVELLDHDLDGVSLALVPLKTIAGKVTSAGPLSVPFAQMNVQADPEDGETPPVVAPVAADGSFRMEVLPASYTLSRPQIAGTYIRAVKIGDREFPGTRVDFARAAGPLEISLATNGGSLSGIVTGADGQPADGARVMLYSLASGKDPQCARAADSGEDGRFELRDLAPGEYRIAAWQSAPQDPGEQAAVLRIAPRSSQTVNLRAR